MVLSCGVPFKILKIMVRCLIVALHWSVNQGFLIWELVIEEQGIVFSAITEIESLKSSSKESDIGKSDNWASHIEVKVIPIRFCNVSTIKRYMECGG